ncbi:RNA polymerase sigma-70 factor [Fulvivirgaceae bacterium BMA10]|uniref:RNA polymerase sigma-70 factor n=1 Tax=Splendidivirga corallicola TaxID=3051826 RepID=A0ABT8KK27_9BACT|nr:RNA polymerase sigma-70 factor [Fulvivirgaceae bacterium BMA10]
MGIEHEDILKHLSKVCKKDDQQSFQVVFETYFERLLDFSISYVKHSEVAEDILADIFIKLWENREKLININNFDAYIFTSVRNQSLKYIEKKKRWTSEPLNEIYGHDNLINNYTPAAEYEFKELRRNFDHAIEELPDQCKRAFQLVRQQKLRYNEVAKILGISVKTVDAHVVKAVKRLREKFKSCRPKK